MIPFILTQKELSEQVIPPREYLLDQWMPKDSFGMVYAPRGVGKSWFCMALGLQYQANKRFLGWDHSTENVFMLMERWLDRAQGAFDNLCMEPNGPYILSSEMLYKDGCPLSLDALEEQRAVDEVLGI